METASAALLVAAVIGVGDSPPRALPAGPDDEATPADIPVSPPDGVDEMGTETGTALPPPKASPTS